MEMVRLQERKEYNGKKESEESSNKIMPNAGVRDGVFVIDADMFPMFSHVSPLNRICKARTPNIQICNHEANFKQRRDFASFGHCNIRSVSGRQESPVLFALVEQQQLMKETSYETSEENNARDWPSWAAVRVVPLRREMGRLN